MTATTTAPETTLQDLLDGFLARGFVPPLLVLVRGAGDGWGLYRHSAGRMALLASSPGIARPPFSFAVLDGKGHATHFHGYAADGPVDRLLAHISGAPLNG